MLTASCFMIPGNSRLSRITIGDITTRCNGPRARANSNSKMNSVAIELETIRSLRLLKSLAARSITQNEETIESSHIAEGCTRIGKKR